MWYLLLVEVCPEFPNSDDKPVSDGSCILIKDDLMSSLKAVCKFPIKYQDNKTDSKTFEPLRIYSTIDYFFMHGVKQLE